MMSAGVNIMGAFVLPRYTHYKCKDGVAEAIRRLAFSAEGFLAA